MDTHPAPDDTAPDPDRDASTVATPAAEPIDFRRHLGGARGAAPDADDAPPAPGGPDRAAGVEFIVLGVVLLAAATYFSERVQRLLELLYNPFVIFVLVLIFAEYLVLKARDRTYALERELELTRRKRHEAERLVADARLVVEALVEAAPPHDTPEAGDATAWERRARGDLEALRERLRPPS